MNAATFQRRVPARIRVNLYVRSITIIVGISLVVFGALLLALADSMADFRSTIQFRDGDPVTMGVLRLQEQTGNYSGGRRGHYVIRYHFEYNVDSARYQGTSYAKPVGIMTGMQVPVAYVPGNPGVARIKGMTSAPFIRTGMWLGLGAVAAMLAGLALLFLGIRKTGRYSHLLRFGILTTGTVTSKVATGTTYNGKAEFEIQLQFLAQDGQSCVAKDKTYEPVMLRSTTPERILYDANNPKNAMLVDGLPADVRTLI